ncbi:MAG: MerR family transcriptional regulator [Blastocatellia bacterium]
MKSFRGQKFVGTTQLADMAARLITELVPRQERASVTEVPDERMVRYYSAEGLISPPEGKQGLSAVYGYSHLLQLLVIKRLQAEHLPIRKIKELVEGKSERELEQMLEVEGDKSKNAAKNAATEYLESLLKPRAPAVPQPPAPQIPAPQLPAPPMAASRRVASRMAAPEALAEISASPSSVNAWSRVEVEPGLELHIRKDYQLPDDVKERQRLARRMLSEIENQEKVRSKNE